MRFWQGEGGTIKVRWFRAAPDAKFLSQENYFTSRNWDSSDQDYPIGEVYGAKRPWKDGSSRVAYEGKHHCGAPRVWANGGVRGQDTAFVVDNLGYSACCGGKAPMPNLGFGYCEDPTWESILGGAALGGSAPLTAQIPIPSLGGVAFGGSAQWQPGDELLASGGVAVGGDAEVSDQAQEALGGVAVGGDAEVSDQGEEALGGVAVGGDAEVSDQAQEALGGIAVGGVAEWEVTPPGGVTIAATTGVTEPGSGGYTVSRPGTPAVGDLILLWGQVFTTDAPTPIPAGFTLRAERDMGFLGRAFLAHKIAGASEPASYAVVDGDMVGALVTACLVTGGDYSAFNDVTNFTSGSINHASGALTLSADGSLVFGAIASRQGFNCVVPVGWISNDARAISPAGEAVGSLEDQPAGAFGPVTFTTSFAQDGWVYLLGIPPA